MYLSVLLHLYVSFLTHGNGDILGQNMVLWLRLFNEDTRGWSFQVPEDISSFESYLPIKRGNYVLGGHINSCTLKKSFLLISSGL